MDRILGKRIKRVHVKDFRTQVGTLHGFTGLLQGDVDWPAVIAALTDIGYNSYLTAEVLPAYRYHSDRLIHECGAAMDAIMGEKDRPHSRDRAGLLLKASSPSLSALGHPASRGRRGKKPSLFGQRRAGLSARSCGLAKIVVLTALTSLKPAARMDWWSDQEGLTWPTSNPAMLR